MKELRAATTTERVRKAIEERECELLYVPPCSLGFDPTEEAFAKIRGLPCKARKAEACTCKDLVEAFGTVISAVTGEDACDFFEHCGFRPRNRLL